MGGFSTSEVERLTGVHCKTLHYWDSSGFLSPSIASAHGTGTRRIYAFDDVVAARVAHELREKGITLKKLRQVMAFLRKFKSVRNPLAETYLITDGKDVYTKRGNTLMSVLRDPGQECLSFLVIDLSRTVAELQRATNTKKPK